MNDAAQPGVLVLVGTPLGNRGDLSPRAREAIVGADLLLCEDTRSPIRLLGEENDWLMSIRSRVGIPGGTSGFDLPAYYAWQHHAPEQRQNDLHHWAATLAPLAEAVYLLLRLMLDSGLPQKVAAERGQFQQNLPPGRTFQLLRLRIDPALQLVPEISGNRLIVSVRLMRQEEGGKLVCSNEDAAFELTLCA